MLQIAPGWQLEVERGPDWLFVRIRRPDTEADDSPPLADRIWWLLEEHFTRRLVLELDELDVLCSYLIGQLVLLHKRIAVGGGMLRLCGLSENNRQVLRFVRLENCFPVYPDRHAAVMGQAVPRRPR